MSDSLLTDYMRTRQRVDQLERIEQGGGAYLTLTRTATLSLATTGTIITWQSEVRSRAITWSGSAITIPSDGYYALDMTCTIGSNTGFSVDLLVGSVAVARLVNSTGGNAFRFIGMRYFSASDSVEVRANVAAARTLAVNAYGTADESPFLHIVKL
jgi:hypothetical protein